MTKTYTTEYIQQPDLHLAQRLSQLALLAIVGQVILLASAWLLPAVSEYTLIGDNISELVLGQYGFIQTIAFVLSGLGILGLAWVIYQLTLGDGAPRFGASLIALFGVSALLAATFPTDRIDSPADLAMNGLPPGLDIPADRSFYMALGFWRACPVMPWVGSGSFGHPGSGGSVAFGDPDAAVGFGYVTNLWSFRIGEPRASNLAKAVVACLG